MQEESKIEKVVDNLQEYVNTRYELMMLQAVEKVSGIASDIIARLIAGFIAVLCIMFLSVAAAYYFETVTGSRTYGFLIVAGIYLLLGIFVVIFRKSLVINPFRNKMIEGFFKEHQSF